MAAVATVLGLVERNPPKSESWDAAQRHGPHLHEQLRAWFKEQL